MTTYMHTPAEIAAALRLLADDFETAPNVRLPQLAVSVDVQVCSWSDATEADRIAAVDLLAFAVQGTEGQRKRMSGSGKWYHTIPYDDRVRADGLEVDVFTADVSAPVEAVAA